jgi:hypothetical protein
LLGTKENFVLFGLAFIIADVILAAAGWMTDFTDQSAIPSNRLLHIKNRLFTYLRLAPWMAISASIIMLIFYTGFFMDWSGVGKFFEAFIFWSNTGTAGNGHSKPFFYWLKILTAFELPLMIGFVVSLYIVFSKALTMPVKLRQYQHLLFFSLLGLMHWFIYSVIAYKTPWCILGFIWPFAFLFAYAFAQIQKTTWRWVGSFSNNQLAL